MSTAPTVAVIGLGLIGGSLARDLAALGWHVLGWDLDPETLARALTDGVVRQALGPRLEGLDGAAVAVLATPVDAVAPLLPSVARWLRDDAVVTDTGSTKAHIVAAAVATGLGPRFVGSHPLAGDHRSGWDATRAGLFIDAVVHLCAPPGCHAGAIARVESLWTSVGARCVHTEAGAHDALMAWVSHLPQVAASAVAAALARAGHGPTDLGRGGRDVTRLAGSSPAMWSAIARANAAPLGESVRALRAELADFEAALGSGDDDALRRWFARGREWAG